MEREGGRERKSKNGSVREELRKRGGQTLKHRGKKRQGRRKGILELRRGTTVGGKDLRKDQRQEYLRRSGMPLAASELMAVRFVLYVCLYVCQYIYLFVCLHVCMFVCIVCCMYIMHACLLVCRCACMDVLCVCLETFMYVCVRTYECTCVCMCVCMRMVCVCVRVCVMVCVYVYTIRAHLCTYQ